MGGSNATRKKLKNGKSGTEKGCCFPLKNAFSRLFCGAPDECRVVKMMLGFPVGLLLGAGLYLCLIRPMQLPGHLRDSLGAILGFSIALGFALSVQVRCVSLLVIPVFFGKKGRSYIATYAIAYLISGPVSNIIFNAGEATRALSCTAKLMANHSKAKMDLRVGPLRDIMLELKEDGFRLKKVISEIDKTFGPIRKEIFGDRETRDLKGKTENMDNTLGGGHRSGKIENRYHENVGESEAVKDERKYEKKLDYRCEDVFSMGAVHCRQKFRELEQNCLNKMPWVGRLLCLPLKLTIICELVKSVPNIIGLDCNSMKVVSPGLGEAYDVADRTTAEFDKSFDVDLKYKVEYSREDIDVVTAKEVTLGIEQEFSGRRRWMDFCLTFFHRMLAFTFLLVFKVAYNYHNQYISNMQYDNNYVTSYFRRIDARRRAEGKRTLLPLKKLEEKEVLFPSSMRMRSTEKRKLIKGTLKLFINIFVIVVIVLVDRMFYSVLEIIQRHSRIDYRQQGVHEIDIKIYGNGFVANLVRHILKGFSQKHSIDNISTNFECLPQPVTVDVRTLYVIFGIHVAVWILMLLESYGLRLRRAIAAFFYRKREKTRILYFYNDLLKRRKGFLQHARHRVKSLARKRRLSKRSGVVLSLRRRFPRLCSCLGVLGSARERCLVCDDPEDKNFVRCITRGCEVGYCQECWIDIKKRCYACMPDEEWEDTSTATEIDTE